MNRRLLLAACALLTATVGCAGREPVARDVIAGDRPALWRVQDADSDLYLFGTFHLLPAGVEWGSATYDEAMKRASTTITEADTTSPEALAEVERAVIELGLNPPGVTLTETLGPERAAQLRALTEEVGAQMAALEPMRPWLAMITVAHIAYMQAGFDGSLGVEATLLEQAAAEGDALSYLETAREQVEMLASLGDEEMFADFDTTMEQFANFEAFSSEFVEAWRTGDLEALERIALDTLRDSSRNLYEVLIVNRNASWTRQIEELLAGEGTYFIAVGVGHLVGDESVVDMLRRNGFEVTRVQ